MKKPEGPESVAVAVDGAMRDVASLSVTEALRVGQAGEQDKPGIGRVVCAASLVAVAFYIVYTAREFEELPRIMPLAFGIPMLVLTAVQLVRELVNWRRVRDTARPPFSWPPFGYFAIACASVLVLGTILGGALLLAALTRWYAKRSIRWSVFVGGIGGLFYYILITALLRAPHYAGLLL